MSDTSNAGDAPASMTGAAGNQRWRDRQDSYVPPDSVIRTSEYEVAAIDSDNVARSFVSQHHYSASYPSARFRYGLYKGPDLVGVAVYSHPVRDVVLTKVFGGAANESTELGRFVLLDAIPGNAETWFLARTHELLRREHDGLRGIVSFSDPFQRTRADGTVTCPGHVGTIYQASNGVYLGRARPDSLLLLPDGTSLPCRAREKVKVGHQGWYSVVGRLIRFPGVIVPAPYLARPTRASVKRPLDALEVVELAAWIKVVVESICRKVRHPGNHKYAWALQRRHRRTLPPLDPKRYPKRVPPQASTSATPLAAVGAA